MPASNFCPTWNLLLEWLVMLWEPLAQAPPPVSNNGRVQLYLSVKRCGLADLSLFDSAGISFVPFLWLTVLWIIAGVSVSLCDSAFSLAFESSKALWFCIFTFQHLGQHPFQCHCLAWNSQHNRQTFLLTSHWILCCSGESDLTCSSLLRTLLSSQKADILFLKNLMALALFRSSHTHPCSSCMNYYLVTTRNFSSSLYSTLGGLNFTKNHGLSFEWPTDKELFLLSMLPSCEHDLKSFVSGLN